MYKHPLSKHPLFKVAFSALITILIFISIIIDYASGKISIEKIIFAFAATLWSIYYILSYKFDGPFLYFNDEFDDERIKSLWALATRNGFYFMVFGTWILVMFLNEPVNSFVLSNISVILSILAVLGPSFVLISFMWYKYRV